MRDALRVRLISTAHTDSPGSMRAYTEELVAAFAEYVSDVELQVAQFAGQTLPGTWARRLEMVGLAAKAAAARPDGDLWHILDGSRAFLETALRRRRVLITAHDFIPVLANRGELAGAPRQGGAARFIWRMNLRSLSRAAGVISDSESTAMDLSRLSTVGRDQCAVVNLPIRGSLSRLQERRRETNRDEGIILHVGNDAFYKNRGQVIKIFSMLDRVVAQKLVMIGPPPNSRLRCLSQDLGVTERVIWKENASDEELADWYTRALLMLFPSLYEGYGWPVIEAMAFGLPVLASNRGSLPEILGPCGPGIPPDATRQWVERAHALLKSSSRRQKLAARCKAHAEAFNRRRFAEEMRQVYLHVARCKSALL